MRDTALAELREEVTNIARRKPTRRTLFKAIVALLVLYVLGLFAYLHSSPRQTDVHAVASAAPSAVVPNPRLHRIPPSPPPVSTPPVVSSAAATSAREAAALDAERELEAELRANVAAADAVDAVPVLEEDEVDLPGDEEDDEGEAETPDEGDGDGANALFKDPPSPPPSPSPSPPPPPPPPPPPSLSPPPPPSPSPSPPPPPLDEDDEGEEGEEEGDGAGDGDVAEESKAGDAAPEAEGKRATMPPKRAAFRLLIVFLVFVAAIAVPDLGALIALLGAVTGSILSLVAPAIINRRCPREKRPFELPADVAFLVVGVVGGALGSYQALLNIVRDPDSLEDEVGR